MEEESWGRNLRGGILGGMTLEVSGRSLGGLWEVSGKSLGGLWKVFGSSLGDLWEVSGRCLGDLWKVSGRSLGALWKVSEALGALGWPRSVLEGKCAKFNRFYCRKCRD